MQTDDFELRAGIDFGEWLRAEIASAVFLEQRGFIPDTVRRVSAQLQRAHPESERFMVEIPRTRAFTAISRRLHSGVVRHRPLQILPARFDQ